MKTVFFALTFLIIFFVAIAATLPLYADECNPLKDEKCIVDPPTLPPGWTNVYLPIIVK